MSSHLEEKSIPEEHKKKIFVLRAAPIVLKKLAHKKNILSSNKKDSTKK